MMVYEIQLSDKFSCQVYSTPVQMFVNNVLKCTSGCQFVTFIDARCVSHLFLDQRNFLLMTDKKMCS